MPDSFAPPFVFRSYFLSKISATFVTVIGVLVLIGWIGNITNFESVYGPITMKANTAIALIMAGVSLFSLTTRSRHFRTLGQVCAAIIALLGLATLSQHVIGWNLHIDELFFHETPGAAATTSPNRMGVTASSCCLLFGVSLLILHRSHRVSLAQALTLIGGLWAMLSVVGYTYRAEQLYAIATYTGIALHTAVSLFVLSIGMLAARLSEGWLSIVGDGSAAGRMARRLMAVGVLAPFILGWLRLAGQRADLFGLGLGTSLLVVAIIIIFVLSVWAAADRLRQTDEALLQHRELLQVTLSSIGDAVIATDVDGRITFLNSIAQAITGWDDEAIGMPVHKVFRIINQQTRGTVDNPALKAMSAGVIIGLANHTILITKAGTEIPIDDSGAPIKDVNGNVLGAVLVFRDVSERRKAERAQALLAEIVESSTDAIISKSLDGTIKSWNEGAQKLFGYSEDEILGKSIALIVPPDRLAEEESILETLERGERIEHFETERITKDGRRVPISLTVSPIKNRSGDIIGASKIARDITQQKHLEHEREKLLVREQLLRTEAQAASKLKDEFLATVSHELRTPLNAILGWGTMLRQREVPPETLKTGIAAIERNARFQAQLIEDLLDVSRIISGKMQLDIKPIEITPIIKSVIESLRPAAEAKQIRLEMIVDPLADHLRADEARLRQIIWNLLSNSVKFSDKGGLIQIRIGSTESMTEIIVTDNGQGISGEFLPYVFDRFQQADSSITRKHGGLGLGLAISRHLVEMHGGTIEANSQGEGHGSTFKVRLPMAAIVFKETKPTQETREELRPATSGSEIPNLSRFKVLAIDDAPDTRQLLRAVLEQFGANVMTASSAREGLELLAAWKPDVVVCDIGMPEEDGYTFITEVRKLSRECGGAVPAIALTGYVRNEDRIRALGAGYQMFVPKPVEATELASLIGSVIGVHAESEHE